jgi:hypothetical protein
MVPKLFPILPWDMFKKKSMFPYSIKYFQNDGERGKDD